MRDLRRDHRRLAGAGPGEHQGDILVGRDRFGLLVGRWMGGYAAGGLPDLCLAAGDEAIVGGLAGCFESLLRCAGCFESTKRCETAVIEQQADANGTAVPKDAPILLEQALGGRMAQVTRAIEAAARFAGAFQQSWSDLLSYSASVGSPNDPQQGRQ